ncbi:hypothetical protein [Halobacteriovorax sp. ZH2_bin.1]|uniref:hypothetical protein n=1 Tax=unclassified Halobacteriovorax TaxID=2639665 RepID=UPI0037185C49
MTYFLLSLASCGGVSYLIAKVLNLTNPSLDVLNVTIIICFIFYFILVILELFKVNLLHYRLKGKILITDQASKQEEVEWLISELNSSMCAINGSKNSILLENVFFSNSLAEDETTYRKRVGNNGVHLYSLFLSVCYLDPDKNVDNLYHEILFQLVAESCTTRSKRFLINFFAVINLVVVSAFFLVPFYAFLVSFFSNMDSVGGKKDSDGSGFIIIIALLLSFGFFLVVTKICSWLWRGIAFRVRDFGYTNIVGKKAFAITDKYFKENEHLCYITEVLERYTTQSKLKNSLFSKSLKLNVPVWSIYHWYIDDIPICEGKAGAQ